MLRLYNRFPRCPLHYQLCKGLPENKISRGLGILLEKIGMLGGLAGRKPTPPTSLCSTIKN
ncbi:hypothetical protein [Calothrix sp. PCC 6303]|uniref:hypothetical protein n=1 Tax=Calothrix sp. PCC 6303 TaxID=1170562 RepID=UPI0002A032BE|nr:hypothetical protein [Calothrix sp. PCC 6303]AFZ00724.1 hypothetical protein Cal6303_1683 [Calothrix sp. PCC 6303]